MTDCNTKLLIVGPGRSGKDEAGAWLSAHTGLRFRGSVSRHLTPYVAERLGVSPEDAFRLRHQQRLVWYEEGRRLREGNPGFLIQRSLAEADIVAGIRDLCELEYAVENGLFSWILWIDRKGFEHDPTLEFSLGDCQRLCKPSFAAPEDHSKLLVISNHLDLRNLFLNLRRFCTESGLCVN